MKTSANRSWLFPEIPEETKSKVLEIHQEPALLEVDTVKDCRDAGHQASKPRAGMTPNTGEQFHLPFPQHPNRQGDAGTKWGPCFKEKSEQ